MRDESVVRFGNEVGVDVQVANCKDVSIVLVLVNHQTNEEKITCNEQKVNQHRDLPFPFVNYYVHRNQEPKLDVAL